MLLQVIADQGSISRADLARATGLTRASVSTLMAELVDNRWVTEAGPGESAGSSGGKRPTLLELDRTSRDIIVMDLSTRPLSGVVVDIAGTPRFEAILEPVETDDTGAVAAASIAKLTARLLDRCEGELLGVGVACPGVIDHEGRVVESVPLGWHDFDLAGCIRSVGAESDDRRIQGPPIQIINDAQAVALAIHRRQAPDSEPDSVSRPAADLVAVRVAFGVGAGVVLGGRLHLGPHRAAGEIAPLVKALMGRPITDPLDVDADDAVVATPELGTAIGSASGHLANVLDIATVYVAVPSAGLNPAFEEAARAAADEAVLSALRPELHLGAVADDGLALHGAAAYLLQTETGLVAG